VGQNRPVPQDLIGAVYDAALQPELWETVLDQVQRWVRSGAGILYLYDARAQAGSFEVMRRLNAERMQDYYAHYRKLDPNLAHRKQLPLGTVTASHHVVPDAEYARSEYYQDFLRTLGRCFYSAGGILTCDGSRYSVFSVLRSRRVGPYSDDELARLQALFPHLRRAFEIGRHLAVGEVERQAMLALLERLPTGVLLVDERGRVVFANRRAEAVLAAGDGLVRDGRGIAATAPHLQPLVARALHDAVETGAGRGSSAGGAFVVPVDGSREAYQVVVTPLRTERVRLDVGRDHICAAVFVQLQGSKPVLSQELLRDLFGLTAAEARVAAALVGGQNPDEIAQVAETSRHTVRAQLSSIYEKLGVHRQAEAVQRVLTSPAALSHDAEPDGES
jgi:DNA-binding CsgD family transcriptional regulator